MSRPPLSDRGLARLQEALDQPDLAATKYRMIRRLARGGMGTVYLVEDADLGREVALKVLSAPDPSGELSRRLLNEARHLARLEHPNIVPVHDVGTLPDGRVFYVMKYIRGQRLDEWRESGAPRPALLRVFQRICEAVAFAHALGVVHRDLKPENIMIGAFGEAVVMDWGVAKALHGAAVDAHEIAVRSGAGVTGPPRVSGAAPGADAETGHGVIIGTPAYMAPEQARGESASIDARADVYALGAVLYSLLAGSPPTSSSAPTRALGGAIPLPLRRLDPGIAPPLASICARAMAESPADRYPTARDLADDVDRYLDGRAVGAHRESLAERALRLGSRYQTFLVLVLAYLVMRVLILLFYRS
jgi:serine/threonine protein kinase